MYIWLDDERKPPHHFVGVSTPEQCIKLIQLYGKVKVLSLDHDLQLIDPETLDERTGYDVLLWLEQNPQYAPEKIRIHSANAGARRKMQLAIESIKRRKVA